MPAFTSRIISFVMFLTFVFLGSIPAFVIPSSQAKKKQRCSQEVTAMVIEVLENSNNEDGVPQYAPVYSVTIDGTTEEIASSRFMSGSPVVGQETVIFINPLNHTDIYEPAREGHSTLLWRIVGFIFMGAGVVFILPKKRMQAAAVKEPI